MRHDDMDDWDTGWRLLLWLFAFILLAAAVLSCLGCATSGSQQAQVCPECPPPVPCYAPAVEPAIMPQLPEGTSADVVVDVLRLALERALGYGEACAKALEAVNTSAQAEPQPH